jgi:hypothetical protein
MYSNRPLSQDTALRQTTTGGTAVVLTDHGQIAHLRLCILLFELQAASFLARLWWLGTCALTLLTLLLRHRCVYLHRICIAIHLGLGVTLHTAAAQHLSPARSLAGCEMTRISHGMHVGRVCGAASDQLVEQPVVWLLHGIILILLLSNLRCTFLLLLLLLLLQDCDGYGCCVSTCRDTAHCD